MPSNREIVDYYNFSKLDYRLYNGSFSNLSMHYGIWEPSIRTHREALMNENRVVGDIAGIRSTDRVMDLGCGYGSTAIWLAVHRGCRVTGVTLSKDQAHEATRLAEIHGVSGLANFVVGDFHHLDFPDAQFDVAIAIESISHSDQKTAVLNEAFRILKSGGRLAIADGYLAKNKNSLTRREIEIARICFEGVHVPPLPERRQFGKWLSRTGFANIRWFDKTTSILPSAAKVNRLGKLLLPISRLFSILGFRSLQISHMKAFIHQYEGFRDGLGTYGVFFATKPIGLRERTSNRPELPAGVLAASATRGQSYPGR